MNVGSFMAGGRYTVELKDRKITVTSRELAGFRKLHLGTYELNTRMSELMWLDIYTWETAFGISAEEVLRTMQDLEQARRHPSSNRHRSSQERLQKGSGISMVFRPASCCTIFLRVSAGAGFVIS